MRRKSLFWALAPPTGGTLGYWPLKTHTIASLLSVVAVLVNILKVKKTFRSYSDSSNGASTTLRHPLVTDS